MQISFHKYQATGNDFVIIDNREAIFPENKHELIRRLCDRKFGIGSDGLILLAPSEKVDFTMKFFNPDGYPGSFCGNGSRAVVSLANALGIIGNSGTFEAYDGLHETKIDGDLIQIRMTDVQNGRQLLNGTFIDTGSPHYIEFVNNLEQLDVVQQGREVRNADVFKPDGSNINYVEKTGEDAISVRTYERGVENETLSCGTGVTAAAIAAASNGMGTNLKITTAGGELRVWFEPGDSGYQNIWLAGPAERVFSGEIEV
jgi:diaminopimelate epimerase